MRLKYQLFIALLVASALLIALMLAVNSWSFNRGFLGYINNNEKVRLEPLAVDLATAYESNGNWNWTKKGRRQWFNLISQYDVGHRIPQLGSPTARATDSKTQRGKRNQTGKPKNSKQRRRPRPPSNANWLVLTDAQKQPLFGIPPAEVQIDWLPILSNDETIGYLGHIPHTQLNRKIDQVFAQQQKRRLGYAAMGMILFSGLLSIALGSRIVKPLLTVNTAVSEINHGNFAHRVNSLRNDELGDLARNVNNLGFTLEQNLAARQRWIAEISHELRTPLAVLQSEIEAIQDGIRAASPDSINSLHAEVLRLNRLINDLHQLSLSDIGGLEYKMQRLSLNDIVTTHLQSNTSAIDSASLTLELYCEKAFIVGDQQRLTQLLDNLLQNSIRYTQAPGYLTVSVEVTATDAVLIWSDSSPGVSDQDHLHLFDPLYRTDESRNRQHGGSGLGLAIAKKIADAHSGSIASTHSHMGGLNIIVSIPLLKERHA